MAAVSDRPVPPLDPDVVDLDELRRNGSHDIEWLLNAAGPSFGDVPENSEVFERLELFGRFFHRVESSAQQETARQVWLSWLDKHAGSIAEPRWVVQRAIDAGKAYAGVATESLRWYSDVELTELPPTADLVAGHIPEAGLVLWYGPAGHGKTHLGIDLANSVGTGLPWHGHAVSRGPVAYVIAEGIGGLARRVDAWKRFHEYSTSTGVRFLPQPVHLLEPTETARFVADLRSWDTPPKLVVFDTLAWCIAPGDENSTRDMTGFVAAIGELRDAVGSTVLVVHHTGHDKTRERGNTALAAASDTVVKIAEEDGRIVMTCTKQREGVPFTPLRFRLVDCAGSVVPQRAIEDGSGDELTAKEREALEDLQAIYVDGEGVSTTRWEEATEISRATFYRARKRLIELGCVRIEKNRNFPIVSNGVSLQEDSDVPF